MNSTAPPLGQREEEIQLIGFRKLPWQSSLQFSLVVACVAMHVQLCHLMLKLGFGPLCARHSNQADDPKIVAKV